jgi:hypothetical protein
MTRPGHHSSERSGLLLLSRPFQCVLPRAVDSLLTPPFRTWPQKGSNSKCVTASADRLWYGLSHHVNPGKPEAQRPEVILWLLPTKAQRPETGSHSITPSYPTLPSLWSYITTWFSDPFYSRMKGQGRQTEHPKEALSTTDERTMLNDPWATVIILNLRI